MILHRFFVLFRWSVIASSGIFGLGVAFWAVLLLWAIFQDIKLKILYHRFNPERVFEAIPQFGWKSYDDLLAELKIAEPLLWPEKDYEPNHLRQCLMSFVNYRVVEIRWVRDSDKKKICKGRLF
jgi:hypothetical protein